MAGKWCVWVRWPWSPGWGIAFVGDSDAEVGAKVPGRVAAVADVLSLPWPMTPCGDE